MIHYNKEFNFIFLIYNRCEKEFPDVCGGIKWRFINKKRWFGAEGGWENPFPSGVYKFAYFC